MSAAEVLALKLASPLYTAVMEWEPDDNPPTVNCGLPLPDKLVLAREVVPSNNVTVPLGTPLEGDCNAIVKVTDWPNNEGFKFEVTVTFVLAWLIVSVTGADVLAKVLESPLYLAIMECAPTPRVETES